MAQEKWLIEDAKVIDIGVVRKLKVALIAGKVDIIGHDEPTARIEVHSVSGKALKVMVNGDTLEIDHPQRNWDNWIEAFKSFGSTAKADISVMVPRDIALKLGVVSATALVSGLTEDATVSSISGDVVVDNIYGDLQLNSVSGELAVRDHYGAISAKTISGDLTATGEIMKFGGNTVSGDIFLDVTGAPDEISASTVSGTITTRLAPGLPAQYRINTVSGRIQLDDSEIKGVRGSYAGTYGDLDKTWLDFKANTVSGGISVLHAVSA
jgi:DUF4097 and DUF4098 domain-containing protein YvlB